jgi:hypothetical protein
MTTRNARSPAYRTAPEAHCLRDASELCGISGKAETAGALN